MSDDPYRDRQRMLAQRAMNPAKSNLEHYFDVLTGERAATREAPQPLFDYSGSFSAIPPQLVPEPLCGEWLRRGTYTIVYARAGKGKTAVCSHLVSCMKDRRDWMTQKTKDPGRVVWVDGDNELWQLQERMAFLGKYPDVELHHVVNKNLLLHTGEIESLCEGAGMVVFDNFSALFHLEDANQAEQWRPFNEFMRRIYSKGPAVILQQHEGKGEGTSAMGSSAQEWTAHNIIRVSTRDISEKESDKLPSYSGARCGKIVWQKHRMSDEPTPMLFATERHQDGSIECNPYPFIDDFNKPRISVTGKGY